MSPANGGPCVPMIVVAPNVDPKAIENLKQLVDHAGIRGLSLRDYFAAQALPMLIQEAQRDGHRVLPSADLVAARAYDFADAMLAARESPEHPDGNPAA